MMPRILGIGMNQEMEFREDRQRIKPQPQQKHQGYGGDSATDATARACGRGCQTGLMNHIAFTYASANWERNVKVLKSAGIEDRKLPLKKKQATNRARLEVC